MGWDRNCDLGPAEAASFFPFVFCKLVWLNPEALEKYLTIQPSFITAWLLALSAQ